MPGEPGQPRDGGKKRGCLIGGLVAAALLVLIGVIAVAAGGGDDEDEEVAASTTTAEVEETTTTEEVEETTTTTEATTTTPPTTAPPLEFTGNGDDIIDVPLTGADVLAIGYQGARNFVVRAGDSLLVNTIGGYLGTVFYASNTPADFIEVQASGPWQITVRPFTQARAWDPSSGPLSGASDDVVLVQPVPSSGTTVDISYTGERNFVVRFWDSDGAADLAVNTIGAYQGAVRLPADTILIEVTSSGDWTVTPR